jgi:hypothetical protein
MDGAYTTSFVEMHTNNEDLAAGVSSIKIAGK